MRTNPVLLVHGFASSFDLNWVRNGWVDLLADAKRPVLSVDLLGHGTAPKPHDPAAYVAMEERVLEALPDDGSVIDAVGFSLGAVTLVRAIGRAPERFGRVVLAGIGKRNMETHDSEPVAAAIEGGLSSIGSGEGTDLARAFAQFALNGTNDPKALAACMRRPVGRLSEDELAKVTCETLVVLGDKDFVAPADPVVAALPNARFHNIRGADHFGTPQNFGFLDAALEFLEAVPA